MSSSRLYLAASTACLTSAFFGYSVGFIGGILVLPSFLHYFGLDVLSQADAAAATSGTVLAWLLGALIGVPLGMPVCSKWGKRACLALAAGVYCLGVGLQLVDVRSLGLFDAGRFINGIGVGVGTLVSPMYIAETSTPQTRGMLLSGYQTVLQLGALIGFWAAFAAHASLPDSSLLQWQIPVVMQVLPGALLLGGTLLIPESPSQLAEQGTYDSARKALSWLRGHPEDSPEVQEELRNLQLHALASSAVKARATSFWREVREKSVRKRLFVGIGLMIAQNMVGLNALNYYAPVVFMSAGFTSVSTSLFLTGLFGLIKVISALSFMFVFVGVRGNRYWLKLGSAVCGAAMVVLAICVQKLPPQITPLPNLNFSTAPPPTGPGMVGLASMESSINPYGLTAVLMVFIFAFFFGLSLGPISWNICSEIFPAHIKPQCCAITTCTQWLFQIVIAGITPRLLSSIGWGMYLVYAACCLATFIWVQFVVPETQGVALGREMDNLFGYEEEDEHQPEVVEEYNETTALLGHAARRASRRDSVGYV